MHMDDNAVTIKLHNLIFETLKNENIAFKKHKQLQISKQSMMNNETMKKNSPPEFV